MALFQIGKNVKHMWFQKHFEKNTNREAEQKKKNVKKKKKKKKNLFFPF